MLKVDFHVHTYNSRDCAMPLAAILRSAAARGVNCLAITDHNSIQGAVEMQKVAPFPIIVGEEIKTQVGEIIGLFLREEIPRDLSAEETVRRIKEQGGLVYIPHPFDRFRRSRLRADALCEIVTQIDIMEVFNSRVSLPRDNGRAEEFARRFHLARAGGSDAHLPYEIGRTFVEMPEFDGPGELLEALARGVVRGRLSIPFVHVGSTINKLRRRYFGGRGR